ncbi:hypothetical protein CDD82_7404 [Ophiocordyceps australis]|uniref:Acyl-protein thioesterase 1 n=1 Tax=Ophiocordyceps australis TaxID=1399860 RepID=A0A2C5ZQ63_9HYPO|nr:hypothetical protein CDD82_7404 [Ophiocordyceps australis]
MPSNRLVITKAYIIPLLASSVFLAWTASRFESAIHLGRLVASSGILGAADMSVHRAAPLIVPAVSRHTATVIFLHGLGDTGHGWEDAVQQWRQRKRLDEVKFVLPTAPMIPITLNMGMRMPGWFDIKSLGPDINSLEKTGHIEDVDGVLESRTYLHSLIQAEVSDGIPSERVIVGGFSQGGAMSIFAGLTAPVKIGGIVGLSSWLLLASAFAQYRPDGDANKETPVLMGHGDGDPLVRYALAQMSERALKDMGYDVTFKTYRGMEHSACLQELNDVEDFFVSRLAAGTK